MSNDWLSGLRAQVEKNPCIILRFRGGEWQQLRDSRHGFRRFTVARSHDLLHGLKIPTVALIFRRDAKAASAYAGIVSYRNAISTLQTRIVVTRGFRISPKSGEELLNLIPEKRHSSNLQSLLDTNASVVQLSPKLSGAVIGSIGAIETNREGLRALAEFFSAPKVYRDASALQEDAVQTALRAFGLAASAQASEIDLVAGRETALGRVGILEDAVIEHDARTVPGLDLIRSDVTGRALFSKGDETLEVITANKRPLEQVFGVDLIYLNVTRQSVVMLQYKMLEPVGGLGGGSDWIYRPEKKLAEEIRRMNRFAAAQESGGSDYRLNPEVFYLKFVKRDGAIRQGGIIITLDHYNRLVEDPASTRGTHGGVRISYERLSGRYLREGAFVELVRSGYIGAHAKQTEHLSALIRAVLDGDKSVVLAVQTRDTALPDYGSDELEA